MNHKKIQQSIDILLRARGENWDHYAKNLMISEAVMVLERVKNEIENDADRGAE